jgi:hypothetical protein
MAVAGAVVVEAALNGGRDRAENEAVPYSAAELAAEARRCADQGATVFHVHARADDGGWTVDPPRYAEVLAELRESVPHGLVSITSIRPEGVRVDEILTLLATLAGNPTTKPDMISVNLGHIVAWEPVVSGLVRRTAHYPNAYEDITRLLAACTAHGIRPELGVMGSWVRQQRGHPARRWCAAGAALVPDRARQPCIWLWCSGRTVHHRQLRRAGGPAAAAFFCLALGSPRPRGGGVRGPRASAGRRGARPCRF